VGRPPRGAYQDRWGGGVEKTYSILQFFLENENKYLLVSYYIFYRKFTIALICFQSRYFINFNISNKVIGEDRFEGERKIFMFIERGHGLRNVEKHWSKH
jgi:hypothetical protein